MELREKNWRDTAEQRRNPDAYDRDSTLRKEDYHDYEAEQKQKRDRAAKKAAKKAKEDELKRKWNAQNRRDMSQSPEE